MKRTIAALALVASGSTVAQPARDGGPDPAFGVAGVATIRPANDALFRFERLRGITLLPDGKVLLIGAATVNGTPRLQPALARLRADGSLDPGFGDAGIAVIDPFGPVFPSGAIAHQALRLENGAIAVIGSPVGDAVLRTFNGCVALFAVDDTGQVDMAFGPGPGPGCIDFGAAMVNSFTEPSGTAALLANGALLVGGPTFSATAPQSAVARLTAAGRLDSGFGIAGVQRYGGTFYGGGSRKPGIALRGTTFHAMGGRGASRGLWAGDTQLAPLSGFGDDGFAGVAWAGAAVVQEAMSFDIDVMGRALLAGISRPSFDEILCNFCVTRFTSAGAVDASFNPDGASPGSVFLRVPGQNSLVVRVLTRADQRVMLAGYATNSPEDSRVVVAALRSDGQLDSRFGDDETPGIRSLDLVPGQGDVAEDAALSPDGRTLVAASSVGGMAGIAWSVVRLVDDAIFADQFD